MAAIMIVAMITTIDMTEAITIDGMTADMIDATMIDGMTATGLVTTETTDTCRFTAVNELVQAPELPGMYLDWPARGPGFACGDAICIGV